MSKSKHLNSYQSYLTQDEPPKTVDMHVHTIRSVDGRLPVKKALEYALINNVGCLSIADHNNIDGVKKAKRFMESNPEKYKDLNLIPGVEISCCDNELGAKFHLLVYGFDVENQKLNDILSEIRKNEQSGYYGLFAVLEANFGIKFSPYEIKKAATNNGDITLDVIAEMAVLHLDENGKPAPYAKTKDEFLEYVKKAWSTNKYNIKSKNKLMLDINNLSLEDIEQVQLPSLNEILPIIKEAGGIPVIAHPKHIKFLNDNGTRIRYDEKDSLSKNKHYDMVKDFIKQFKQKADEFNLDAGMEVFFAADAHKSQFYMDIAEQNGLIPSGGSDFHGAHKSKNHRIGTVSNKYYITKLPIVDYFNNGRDIRKIDYPEHASQFYVSISPIIRKKYASKNEGIIDKKRFKQTENMQAVLDKFGTEPVPVYSLQDRTLSIRRRSSLLEIEKEIYNLIIADKNLVKKAEQSKSSCIKNFKNLEKHYKRYKYLFGFYEMKINAFNEYDSLENKDKFSTYLDNKFKTLKKEHMEQINRRKQMYREFNIDIFKQLKNLKNGKQTNKVNEVEQ